MCDIWRVRNTKPRRFTFAQRHSSDHIQRRFVYAFLSNTHQEFVTITEILTSISADHSTVLFFLSNKKTRLRDKGIWKFKDSLAKDQNYKRDDTLMTSIKIVQFLRPPTPFVHLCPKFFNPLDLGRPITNKPLLSK